MAKKGKKKGGPRELEVAGTLCLACANLSATGRDDRRRDGRVQLSKPLAAYPRLVGWAQRMGALAPELAEGLRRAAAERPEEAAAALVRAAGLSAALLRLFTDLATGAEHRAEDVAILNRILRKREVIFEGAEFRRGWLADEAALDHMLWPVAESAAELLASDRLRKVRQSATAGCSRLFVYANSRRRWCDANTCGNRAKGKRYHDMVRRIEGEVAGMSYDEVTESRKRRMKELEAQAEQTAKKKEQLRETLKRVKAWRPGPPTEATGGPEAES